MVLESARWLVTNGDSIDIRRDKWLASGDMAEVLDHSELSLVQEIIDPSTKGWDIGKIRQNFSVSTAIKILQAPIAWNCSKHLSLVAMC